MQDIWQQLSKEISGSVARAGRSIVAIDGRAGHTSSGIVWKDDLVLTASHAIRQENNVRVILDSGKAVPARLAGRAPSADVAVLKVEQQVSGSAAEFGTTADLAVGEIVVAIGRTRRGNIVASAGILSGLMGEWRAGRSRIDQFIRPDLTLYSGFSGGALIGAEGKILGMTTSALLRGRPLTIPASTLTRIGDELAARGHTTNPYIGVVMQPVTIPEAVRQKSGMSTEAGLLVMHVEASGPADSAGMMLGDIIVSLDGHDFDSLDDLHDVLLQRGVGATVNAIVIRGGQKVELTIKIGQRPVR